MHAMLAVCIAVIFAASISCTSTSAIQMTSLQLTAREFTGDVNKTSAMAAVTGMARNITDSSLKNVTVAVMFYDAEHNAVGRGSSSRESLAPGETWNFTVQLTSPDAWKARSYDINTSSQ
jgi:hypothetical protein